MQKWDSFGYPANGEYEVSPRIVRNEVRKEKERKLAFQMSFCRITRISILFHGRIQVLNVFYQGIKTSQSLFMCVYLVQYCI